MNYLKFPVIQKNLKVLDRLSIFIVDLNFSIKSTNNTRAQKDIMKFLLDWNMIYKFWIKLYFFIILQLNMFFSYFLRQISKPSKPSKPVINL